MKVAIYHPFYNFADNYSLSHVVKEQMLMLTEHGVQVNFVTDSSFKEPLPSSVEKHSWGSGDALAGCSHIFTHDIIYLDEYRNHEKRLRRYAKRAKKVKWLHWTHSAPDSDPRQHKPWPNSIYVCMNRTDIPLMARMYGVPEALCRVVYNPRSAGSFFNFHKETEQLINIHGLMDCDVLCTYPLDTGRFDAKGGAKIIKLIESMRKHKANAKVVFVNAAADTPERREVAKKHAKPHVIFTSLFNKEWETVTPNWLVRELMLISNVFPLLSDSEGCSLTMLEAGLTKQLIILNADFPPMREFGEIDHVLYMKTGSTRCKTQYSKGEQFYYDEMAKVVLSHVQADKALRFNRKVLKKFRRDWIWRNQLQPLLQ